MCKALGSISRTKKSKKKKGERRENKSDKILRNIPR
jgi:hypothetical protein